MRSRGLAWRGCVKGGWGRPSSLPMTDGVEGSATSGSGHSLPLPTTAVPASSASCTHAPLRRRGVRTEGGRRSLSLPISGRSGRPGWHCVGRPPQQPPLLSIRCQSPAKTPGLSEHAEDALPEAQDSLLPLLRPISSSSSAQQESGEGGRDIHTHKPSCSSRRSRKASLIARSS